MSAHSLDSVLAINGPFNFDLLIEGGKALPALWRDYSNAEAPRWLRRRLGFKQSELARRSGVAQSQISKIEAGGDALLSTWTKLFRAMGVGLRVLPVAEDPKEVVRAAKADRGSRDYRQVPRVRPCKKAKSGST